jgi:hypothetical protein
VVPKKQLRSLEKEASKMKVKDLIALLQECNPDTEVYTFNDHEIHAIDAIDEIDEWVHLNLGERQ